MKLFKRLAVLGGLVFAGVALRNYLLRMEEQVGDAVPPVSHSGATPSKAEPASNPFQGEQTTQDPGLNR